MSSVIEITAPSRLHFGLLSFGQPAMRQFGGVGAMIDQPGLRLLISPADRFSPEGRLSERVRATVERISSKLRLDTAPACRIEVLTAPGEHVGLGTGTQLSLAVAAGLNAFLGRQELEPAELATLAGRGERSAIGTYGFAHGGMLVETGKAAGEPLSPLHQRVELPDAWRFVLVCPQDQCGLSGDAERRAFRELPPVPLETTARLLNEVFEELLPAAVERQFERFSESLYRYGYAAGMCFADRQGGPFASPRAAKLVRTIRELGIRGVGQSSWGPTLFTLLPSVQGADTFIGRIRQHLSDADTVLVARPNNSGAQITQHAQR
ncbi:MAG: beta-RFAP synthase [Planctomycetia bacterium]|nr:beta-RFAP synthase [Planctomycetia bacterium]